MRKPKSKTRAKLACNKAGSEEFALMLKNEIEKQELMAEYKAIRAGLDYQNMNEERKREFLCQMFSN